MTQYTPGPWNYAGPSDIGRDTYSIYGNGPLAYTAGPSDYGDAAEANARLIAAAPMMLGAIEKAGRIVGQVQDNPRMSADERAYALSRACDALGGTYFKTTGRPLEWWRYEAAIDKATGQEVTQGNGSPR